MRGLTYEELAAAYELRWGFDRPTPWKWIAREFGVTDEQLRKAIQRLEAGGLNRDANGEKPLSRVTKISDDQLEQICASRAAGNTWPRIASVLGLPEGTLRARYWRWKQRKNLASA